MLGQHLQTFPMYQVSGIHPAFSQEKYHPLPLLAPEACSRRACTSDEPAQTGRDTIQAVGVPAAPGVTATLGVATEPTTSAKSPCPVQPTPVVPPATTQPAGLPAKAVGSHGPSAAATTAGGAAMGDLDKDLDDLLAASCPAGRSSIGQHGQSRKSAAQGSSAVTPQPSHAASSNQQTANKTPAKGNTRNAKAALEDWLEL